jgi:hypothetical protein
VDGDPAGGGNGAGGVAVVAAAVVGGGSTERVTAELVGSSVGTDG